MSRWTTQGIDRNVTGIERWMCELNDPAGDLVSTSMSPVSVIAGVRGELPPHRYNQGEITEALIDLGRWEPYADALRSLHESAKVSTRYFALPLADYVNLTHFGAINDTF